MIALIEAHRAGLLARAQWLRNLAAGVVVGVVALPLAMAFAIASGARPEQGLYTAIVAGGLVTILGGSRVQIAGPTGAFIAILAVVSAKYGIAGLQVATLMAGIMLMLMGFARMGSVIKFIPAPVIVGFTAGIGVIIFVGQWGDFLGLPKVEGGHFHEKFWHLLQVLPQAHAPTAFIAGLSLMLVLITPRIKYLSRVPSPLVAMVVATALQAHGVTVWLDVLEMKIGDSLRRKIDAGLAGSRFGVVVLSPAFLRKKWTQYELDGLVTMQVSGEQSMLPIWHQISHGEVRAASPSLADKVARSTADLSVDEIAAEIAEVVKRPTPS